MTSFSSLLSSISGQPQAPQSKASTANKPAQHNPASAIPKSIANGVNGASMAPHNSAAGVKRRLEDSSPVTMQAKVARITSSNGPVRPATHITSPAKTAPSGPISGTAYRGTAKKSAPESVVKPPSRPASRPGASTSVAGSASQITISDGSAPKPKRGFAALMEKAKASQAASSMAGPSGIKHKAAEKLSRRDREKMQKDAALLKQKTIRKGSQSASSHRNGGQASGESQVAPLKKSQESSYKGTMRKSAPELAYRGTMRPAGSNTSAPKPAAKKGLGQEEYGGYAAWSDLDEAEDEEDYDSEGSSDMEGGFDEMEREETVALRAARKEDQEALEEEERHRREKEERKKRLLALNKSAAARRKI